MLTTFTYRLYPSARQERRLSRHLEECRWLWNHLLGERKTAWEEWQESLTYYDQQHALPSLQDGARPTLTQVHSQVVQQVAKRAYLAFAASFRWLGATPGSPRFRGARRSESEEQAAWKQRQRRRRAVARIRWGRNEFTHQRRRRLVKQFDLIAIEDLAVSHRIQKGPRAKSMHDAAWGPCAELMSVKAAWAGRSFMAVDPAYASQDCSSCGNRKTDLTLADRLSQRRNHDCLLSIDRDLNAARNMLARGQACLAQAEKPLRSNASGVVTIAQL
jgi:IS605 OrfB family transposase